MSGVYRGEGAYPLRDGGIARQVPPDGWCFAHACIDQLHRLGVEVTFDAESFLRRCFTFLLNNLGEADLRAWLGDGAVLLNDADAHAATRRVFAAREALLHRVHRDRDFNNAVMDLVVSLAAPAVLQRPVVVYTGGVRRDEDDVLLGAGHSAPRECFIPETHR